VPDTQLIYLTKNFVFSFFTFHFFFLFRIEKSREMKSICKILLVSFISALNIQTGKSQVCNIICNGGFDSVLVAPSGNVHVNSAQLTCWQTTSPDSLMEIWASGSAGILAFNGNQFMEMNSFFPASIYQDVALTAGDNVNIKFAHRGRAGIDTMSVSVGPVGGPDTVLGYFGDGNNAWGYHSVSFSVPNTGMYSIRFNTVYWASGNATIGNFLDAVEVCIYNTCGIVCNGGFDSTMITTSLASIHSSLLPCWETTASDTIVEVWANGHQGYSSFSGIQFLELNAYMPSTVFQNITAMPGSVLSISFAHRGRGGTDSMAVSAGPVGGPYTDLGTFGDGPNGWGYYTVNYNVPNAGTAYSIRFTSVHSIGPTIGNFLDAVDVCETTGFPAIESKGIANVFPNPSPGLVTFALLEGDRDTYALSLFDLQGKKVYTHMNISGPSVEIDLRNLENGLYFYKLNSEKKTAEGKVLLAR
jgi:hypothetical protein